MTPLEIHCLLEYHCHPLGSPDITKRHSMGVEVLLKYGMIVVNEDHQEYEPVHSITPKGTFYVEQLECLQLPVSVFVIPAKDS